MFPVNLHQNLAHLLHWYPHEHATLKCLREAVKEDGIQGPFAQQLLETVSMELNCPTDSKQLAHAISTVDNIWTSWLFTKMNVTNKLIVMPEPMLLYTMNVCWGKAYMPLQ